MQNNDSISIKILGIPGKKQSSRFRTFTTPTGKTAIASYQTKDIKDSEKNIKYEIRSQLPEDFIPFDNAISVSLTCIFPPLKSWSKKQLKEIEDGNLVYKTTKPDVDNITKLYFDAMNGSVYRDDAIIGLYKVRKIFGLVPSVNIKITKL